ncbi:MAG: hypothetical protein OGMRLDGQ_002149, partial [Candidatus Fervidibacter sp.]
RAKFERVKGLNSLLHPSSTPCAQVVKTAHATGFSQWLMTNLLSTEFIRRKILEGASPDAPNFSAALQKTIRYSLLATRCRFG